MLAVKNDRLAAAVLLIEAGGNINAQAANMDSPWLLAGALGRTEMVRHMIPRGPDFSLRNRFGGNALIPACERVHVDTVKLLLTTKIDVNHVNNLGWTCLLEIVILGDGGARHWKWASWFSPRVLIRTSRTRTECRRSLTPVAKGKGRLGG